MSYKEKNPSVSITILGESSVGKTCICDIFFGIEFHNDHLSTVGFEKFEKNLTLKDGEQLKLRVWDTAGQERYKSISYNTIKNADACIVVFDLTNKRSFECVNNWIQTINENSYSNLPIGLIGNKCDLSTREVTQEEIDAFCSIQKIKYFKTSAKLNDGINEAFTTMANLAYQNKKERRRNTITLNKEKIKSKKSHFC